MWHLLRTELLSRGGALAVGLALVVAAGLGLGLLMESPVALSGTICGAILLAPLVVNAAAAAVDAREGRPRLHLSLPLTRLQVGLTYTLVPALVQAAAAALALLFIAVARPAATGPATSWPEVLWMAVALLAVGQWIVFVRELWLRRWRAAAKVASAALMLLASLGGPLMLRAVLAGRLGWHPAAAFAGQMAFALLAAAALAVLSTRLFTRRDATEG